MNIPDTSFEEEPIFNTNGTSIDDAFSDIDIDLDIEIEEDCDEVEEDDYDEDLDEM